MNAVIAEANTKLPSNLQIIQAPLMATTVEHTQDEIQIFGYFIIQDIADFTLMKITPTPVKIENNSYWTLDVPSSILAVDYNDQQYFLLSDEEYEACISTLKNSYVCSSTSVKNIETNPNCVVDEIYHRIGTPPCETRKNVITSTIWKELYMPSTWMYITTKPTQVAITCNGIREDIELKTTGIIQVSQNCIIKTKQNILTPKRITTTPVLSSYSKATTVNFTEIHPHVQTKVEEEPIFSMSEDLNVIANNARKEENKLQDTHWKQIKAHTYATSGITVVIILILLTSIWGINKAISTFKKKRNPPKRTNHEKETAAIELQPLSHFVAAQDGENV